MKTYHDKSFRDITTFKIGGPIENLFYPESTEELQALMVLLKGKRFSVIGAGSKILAGYGPFKNVVCTTKLKGLIFNDTKLEAAAGELTPHVARECAKRGLSGLGFLIDIPATIGGAVFMNAGFVGQDIERVCVAVEYVSFEGQVRETRDIQWKRRWCSLQNLQGVITKATFQLGKSEQTQSWLELYHKIRDEHQPRNAASAGGIFINHKVLPNIISALPYLRYGDAEIVKNCPNFIVNHGSATFEEVLHLISLIESYASTLGFSMDKEIKIMM